MGVAAWRARGAGDNGQLALRSLASSTLHTLLPKLETRGQLGAARWRLVGAPALPNLLGVLDVASGPDVAADSMDPAKLLSRLAVGACACVGRAGRRAGRGKARLCSWVAAGGGGGGAQARSWSSCGATL